MSTNYIVDVHVDWEAPPVGITNDLGIKCTTCTYNLVAKVAEHTSFSITILDSHEITRFCSSEFILGERGKGYIFDCVCAIHVYVSSVMSFSIQMFYVYFNIKIPSS